MSSLHYNYAYQHFRINLSLESDKEQKLKEINNAINALLNSDGGEVHLSFNGGSQLVNNVSTKIEIDQYLKKIEQFLQSTAGDLTTSSNLDFQRFAYSNMITVRVKKADRVVTMKYNICVATPATIAESLQSPREVLDTILNRTVVPNGIELGSHVKKFVEKQDCQFHEGRNLQLKSPKTSPSENTALADRMTKSNGFTPYVSMFANNRGGHIYHGISGDDGVVERELIPNADGKSQIEKKFENTINDMIWPEEIDHPKQGKHWEIFFVPVVDEYSEPIPSTFVIVIYIAPCLGGVFTKAPECYEMVEGKVEKMSFSTWKERSLKEHLDSSSQAHRTPEMSILNIPFSIIKYKKQTDKKRKDDFVKKVLICICAYLNSNGGIIEMCFIPSEVKVVQNNQISKFVRGIEQPCIEIIGLQLTASNINFELFETKIVCKVEKAESFLTTNYNLYLPSYAQAVSIPSPEDIKDNILNRNFVPDPVLPGSHHKIFTMDHLCGFTESKSVEFKCVEAAPTGKTTLADRMTGPSNKLNCYVSAFANFNGGHIYFGITDNGVVEGELIPIADDIIQITKKVEKAINGKMIWPAYIGRPNRGEHWEILFEQVLDVNSKPIPSAYVIVIYIAPCLGGVFAKEPECYQVVDGKVKEMSFLTWKRRLYQVQP